MASQDGTWSKGKFYSAKTKMALGDAQRKQLEKRELNLSTGAYAKAYAKGQDRDARGAMARTVQSAQSVNTREITRDPGRGRVVRAYGPDPAQSYEMRYEIRELGQLQTSNVDSGAINPLYPQELQPRDRTRVASDRQVDNIARNLSPDAYLEEFRSIDRGAPIIGDDDAVESGNARTIALRRAAQMYPERYAEYRQRLAEVATERGIDPSEIEKFKQPVLVRVHAKPVDRVAFANAANTAPVLSMSDYEKAKTDAERISTRDLLNLDVGEGDIDTALKRRSNRDFVRGFVTRLPETERAALMTREGDLTQSGSRRIKAALFARVYGDGRIGERVFESQDDDMRNITSGLMGSLGRMAQSEEMIKSGQRANDLSITVDITTAVGKLATLRENKMSVSDYLAQGKLFGDELSPRQVQILQGFDERRRSGKKVKDWLAGWADLVESQPHPQQASVFGGGGDSPDALMGRWMSANIEKEQGGLGLW